MIPIQIWRDNFRIWVKYFSWHQLSASKAGLHRIELFCQCAVRLAARWARKQSGSTVLTSHWQLCKEQGLALGTASNSALLPNGISQFHVKFSFHDHKNQPILFYSIFIIYQGHHKVKIPSHSVLLVSPTAKGAKQSFRTKLILIISVFSFHGVKVSLMSLFFISLITFLL